MNRRTQFQLTLAVLMGGVFLPSARAAAEPTTAPTVSMTASAPATAPATQPLADRRSFLLTAAPLPVPAFRYRFDTDPSEYIDGDAAPLYLQALLVSMPDDREKAIDDLFAEDFDDDASWARLASQRVPWLDTEVPPLIVDANRRSRCDWSPPIRERGYEVLLPHLNHLRHMLNILELKSRIAVTHGNVNAALALAQAMAILSDRTDDGGETFVVSELVSVGMYAVTLNRIERLMSMPDCPNLYWAVRNLPPQFGNQLAAARTECSIRALMLPLFARTKLDEITPAQWKDSLLQIRAKLVEMNRRYPFWTPTGKLPISEIAARFSDEAAMRANDHIAVPAARAQYARTRGLSAADAEQVDPDVVVAMYYYESFVEQVDALLAAFTLPYPQRLAAVRAASEGLPTWQAAQPSNPYATLVESLDRFVVTNARTDRVTAGLGVVEAIRTYASTHAGKLPPTLDAIGEQTPAPDNPVTGKPFGYRVDGDAAIVSDDGAAIGRGAAAYPMRYEVQIRR